jgi:hypothetical protein
VCQPTFATNLQQRHPHYYATPQQSPSTVNDFDPHRRSDIALPSMPTTTESQSSIRSSTTSRSSSSYFTYPVSYAVSGLLRRLSHDPNNSLKGTTSGTTSLDQSVQSIDSMDGVYTPPRRKLSPFQPPPLTPLSLTGWKLGTRESGKLLTKALAEEIRLLVPPRLQLVDEWSLAYSLEQNGVSLATLYEKSDDYRGKRGGFVLVVQDSSGGVRILSFQPYNFNAEQTFRCSEPT